MFRLGFRIRLVSGSVYWDNYAALYGNVIRIHSPTLAEAPARQGCFLPKVRSGVELLHAMDGIWGPTARVVL